MPTNRVELVRKDGVLCLWENGEFVPLAVSGGEVDLEPVLARLDEDEARLAALEMEAPADGGWIDVTSEFLFGVKGDRVHWINLGSGGAFIAKAKFSPGSCKVKIYGKVGAGAVYPASGTQWRIYPLTARVTPTDRAFGALRLWFEGQGSMTGGQAGVYYEAGGTPPYWYISAMWTPVTQSPGWLTSDYPARGTTSMWAINGSYFFVDGLEYETN